MQNDACLLFAVLISNNTRRSRPGILHHNAVSLKLLDRDNKCLSIVELALRQRGTWRYNRYLTSVGKQSGELGKERRFDGLHPQVVTDCGELATTTTLGL